MVSPFDSNFDYNTNNFINPSETPTLLSAPPDQMILSTSDLLSLVNQINKVVPSFPIPTEPPLPDLYPIGYSFLSKDNSFVIIKKDETGTIRSWKSNDPLCAMLFINYMNNACTKEWEEFFNDFFQNDLELKDWNLFIDSVVPLVFKHLAKSSLQATTLNSFEIYLSLWKKRTTFFKFLTKPLSEIPTINKINVQTGFSLVHFLFLCDRENPILTNGQIAVLLCGRSFPCIWSYSGKNRYKDTLDLYNIKLNPEIQNKVLEFITPSILQYFQFFECKNPKINTNLLEWLQTDSDMEEYDKYFDLSNIDMVTKNSNTHVKLLYDFEIIFLSNHQFEPNRNKLLKIARFLFATMPKNRFSNHLCVFICSKSEKYILGNKIIELIRQDIDLYQYIQQCLLKLLNSNDPYGKFLTLPDNNYGKIFRQFLSELPHHKVSQSPFTPNSANAFSTIESNLPALPPSQQSGIFNPAPVTSTPNTIGQRVYQLSKETPPPSFMNAPFHYDYFSNTITPLQNTTSNAALPILTPSVINAPFKYDNSSNTIPPLQNTTSNAALPTQGQSLRFEQTSAPTNPSYAITIQGKDITISKNVKGVQNPAKIYSHIGGKFFVNYLKDNIPQDRVGYIEGLFTSKHSNEVFESLILSFGPTLFEFYNENSNFRSMFPNRVKSFFTFLCTPFFEKRTLSALSPKSTATLLFISFIADPDKTLFQKVEMEYIEALCNYAFPPNWSFQPSNRYEDALKSYNLQLPKNHQAQAKKYFEEILEAIVQKQQTAQPTINTSLIELVESSGTILDQADVLGDFENMILQDALPPLISYEYISKVLDTCFTNLSGSSSADRILIQLLPWNNQNGSSKRISEIILNNTGLCKLVFNSIINFLYLRSDKSIFLCSENNLYRPLIKAFMISLLSSIDRAETNGSNINNINFTFPIHEIQQENPTPQKPANKRKVPEATINSTNVAQPPTKIPRRINQIKSVSNHNTQFMPAITTTTTATLPSHFNIPSVLVQQFAMPAKNIDVDHQTNAAQNPNQLPIDLDPELFNNLDPSSLTEVDSSMALEHFPKPLEIPMWKVISDLQSKPLATINPLLSIGLSEKSSISEVVLLLKKGISPIWNLDQDAPKSILYSEIIFQKQLRSTSGIDLVITQDENLELLHKQMLQSIFESKLRGWKIATKSQNPKNLEDEFLKLKNQILDHFLSNADAVGFLLKVTLKLLSIESLGIAFAHIFERLTRTSQEDTDQSSIQHCLVKHFSNLYNHLNPDKTEQLKQRLIDILEKADEEPIETSNWSESWHQTIQSAIESCENNKLPELEIIQRLAECPLDKHAIKRSGGLYPFFRLMGELLEIDPNMDENTLSDIDFKYFIPVLTFDIADLKVFKSYDSHHIPKTKENSIIITNAKTAKALITHNLPLRTCIIESTSEIYKSVGTLKMNYKDNWTLLTSNEKQTNNSNVKEICELLNPKLFERSHSETLEKLLTDSACALLDESILFFKDKLTLIWTAFAHWRYQGKLLSKLMINSAPSDGTVIETAKPSPSQPKNPAKKFSLHSLNFYKNADLPVIEHFQIWKKVLVTQVYLNELNTSKDPAKAKHIRLKALTQINTITKYIKEEELTRFVEAANPNQPHPFNPPSGILSHKNASLPNAQLLLEQPPLNTIPPFQTQNIQTAPAPQKTDSTSLPNTNEPVIYRDRNNFFDTQTFLPIETITAAGKAIIDNKNPEVNKLMTELLQELQHPETQEFVQGTIQKLAEIGKGMAEDYPVRIFEIFQQDTSKLWAAEVKNPKLVNILRSNDKYRLLIRR